MSERVYVWDKFVRFFHWSLVALFIISYLTGEEESALHIYSGYAIVPLILARIVWGFIGSTHARFTNFLKSPAAVINYARGFFRGNPKHYLGHNPLGGLMVVAMLLTLLAITFSGLKLYAVEEGKGPFANNSSVQLITQAVADDDEEDEADEHEEHRRHAVGGQEEGEEFWEEFHEIAVNLMLLLIILHIAGVALSSLLHHESLVKAMVTGYKIKT